MSTHMPGFQSFCMSFASFCVGQISHRQHKVKKGMFIPVVPLAFSSYSLTSSSLLFHESIVVMGSAPSSTANCINNIIILLRNVQ